MSVPVARNIKFFRNYATSFRSWHLMQKDSIAYLDDFGIAASSPASIDNDSDGMADAWEIYYLGGTNAVPAADTDGDGVDNYHEYIAGTIPTDSASYMRVIHFDLVNETSTNLLIKWIGGATASSTPFSSVGDRDGRVFFVKSVDNDASEPKTTRALVSASGTGTNQWTDYGAVQGQVARYYQVAVSYAGNSYTNTEEWTLHVQPRRNNNLYMIGIPVDYGTNNTLKGLLGQHVARGLHPSSSTAAADRIYFRTTNNVWKEFYYVTNAAGTAMWWDYDTDTNAELSVTPVTGLWVERRSGTPRTRTNCVFTGRVHTNSPPVIVRTNGAANGWAWTVFAWPFSRACKQINYGIGSTPSNQLGFEYMAYGGKTMDAERPHADKGDQLWIWESNTFKRVYWLMGGVGTNYDGRWWSDRDNAFGNIRLEAGKAYFFRHHVGSNGWITGTNFIWQPVP